jgi:hypothetical protein
MTGKVRLDKRDERDVHSQGGEDGIIAKVVATLGIERGVSVEFGACGTACICPIRQRSGKAVGLPSSSKATWRRCASCSKK